MRGDAKGAEPLSHETDHLQQAGTSLHAKIKQQRRPFSSIFEVGEGCDFWKSKSKRGPVGRGPRLLLRSGTREHVAH
jgi:hypothetical protein